MRGSELGFPFASSLSTSGEVSRKGLFGESRMGKLDSGVTGGEFGTGEMIGVDVAVVGLRLEGGGDRGAIALAPLLFSRR